VEVLSFCLVGPADTGLTGTTHRSDRCSPVLLEFLVPLHSIVGVDGCWFLRLVALKWLRGLG
jgi:hypothetical protein